MQMLCIKFEAPEMYSNASKKSNIKLYIMSKAKSSHVIYVIQNFMPTVKFMTGNLSMSCQLAMPSPPPTLNCNLLTFGDKFRKYVTLYMLKSCLEPMNQLPMI